MLIDFHTHTYNSYDCLMQPEKILRLAKERGLNGIVINDHDTIKGGKECAQLNKDADFNVIVAAEIKVDRVGDVTGLFLKEEVVARDFNGVVTEIKKQGGITVLNHPYVHHDLNEVNFDGIDLIEGYNGRTDEKRNLQAVELAKKYNKPVIAGSDSHTYGEIANCKTMVASLDTITHPLSTEYKLCSVWAPVVSQIIKANKRKDVGLLLNVLLGIPKQLYRRMI